MIYLFDEFGRCVFSGTDDSCLDKHMKSFGAVECAEHKEVMDNADVHLRNGKVERRPPNPAVQDGMWLRRVPPHAKIRIEGATYIADDSDVELDFQYPGTYKVKVESWPHKDVEFEVTKP